jgi:Family of unknown function (DUF5678)
MSTVERDTSQAVPLAPSEVRIWDDISWAENNEETQRRYAGMWIAICDRRVVAHGLDRDQVERDASDATNRPLHELAIWPVSDPASMLSELSSDGLVI